MMFQDDSGTDFRLLCAALKALADLSQPDAKWIKRHLKIYTHALSVADEDKKMHAQGWTGSNGSYDKAEHRESK